MNGRASAGRDDKETGFAPTIVNRACIHLPNEGPTDCQWSNRVVHYTYIWPIYLPVVMRQ